MTEDDVEQLLAVFRGGLDACHMFDAVRGGVQAGARHAGLDGVGDREARFIHELLLIHAVLAPRSQSSAQAAGLPLSASDANAPADQASGVEGALNALVAVVAHTSGGFPIGVPSSSRRASSSADAGARPSEGSTLVASDSGAASNQEGAAAVTAVAPRSDSEPSASGAIVPGSGISE